MSFPSFKPFCRPLLALGSWRAHLKFLTPLTRLSDQAQDIRVGDIPGTSQHFPRFQSSSENAADSSMMPVANGESACRNQIDDVDDAAETVLEDSFSPCVETGGKEWGEVALQCVDTILSTPKMAGLRLFSFQASKFGSRLLIRLDKITNQFGSPELREIQEFSSMMTNLMQEKLGEEEAGGIEMEVSSPGAERQLRIPGDFARFRDFPMKVVYVGDNGAENRGVLKFDGIQVKQDNSRVSNWRIADTKVKRAERKGRPLTKKQLAEILSIPLERLRTVNIYLDV